MDHNRCNHVFGRTYLSGAKTSAVHQKAVGPYHGDSIRPLDTGGLLSDLRSGILCGYKSTASSACRSTESSHWRPVVHVSRKRMDFEEVRSMSVEGGAQPTSLTQRNNIGNIISAAV